MAEVKATVAKPLTNNGGHKSGNTLMFNLIVVLLCIGLGWLIYALVLGSPGNFNDPEKKVPKNLMGTMYHGGFLVPFLIASLFTMLAFTFERFFTVFKSRGKMSNNDFIREVRKCLDAKNISGALALCDKQGGSVGNVMRSGVIKYGEMANASGMTQEQKLASIQKEVEETTSMELPMLEKNLVFLSTIASVATLLGLLGTVFGMIKAFRAMGQAGAPDANALATGISEALVNTALGIGTSFFAIIFYNFFTTIIDQVTHGIDECGFSLGQSFKSNYPA
jgi:biopolymer transport protein ExbB